MVIRVGVDRLVGLLLAFALVAAACTTESEVTASTVAASSTTSTSTTTSTIAPETTSTTSMAQRIAEVTEIIREVDFTFFNAIYLKDEAMLADALAVQDRYDNGLELMNDDGYFTQRPTRDGILIEVLEILVDRKDCLAVSYNVDVSAFRGPDARDGTVAVFWPRPSDDGWRRAYLGDEWQEACDDFSRAAQLP